MLIEDDNARRSCIDAAQEPRIGPAPQPTPEQPQLVTEQPPAAEQRPPASEQPQLTGEQPEPVAEQPPTMQEQLVAPTNNEPTRPAPRRPTPQRTRWQEQEPAGKFSGNVSRIYQSILDRQLIAVDSTYLFESDRAGLAGFEEGERVEVEKMASRFGSGRRWRITSSSRTRITAYRVRCEVENIRADDRRKCTLMLDR